MKEILVNGKVVGNDYGVVINLGSFGKDDSIEIGSPCVIKDNGIYKMWYSGCDINGLWRIYYATSEDGVTWKKNGVVIPLGIDGESDSYHVSTPSVIYDGKTYHMWYGGCDNFVWQIHYATSIDAVNWKKHGIIPSLMDDYSNNFSPSVIYDGVIFRMWYINCTTNCRDVCYAISKDGVAWTKHDPVEGLCSGERGCLDIDSPSVIYDGEVYHMFLTNDDGKTNSIYHTTSTDGKVWKKCKTIIDVGIKGDSDCVDICSQTVIKHNDMLKIWYVGFDGNKNRLHYAEIDVKKLKEVI